MSDIANLQEQITTLADNLQKTNSALEAAQNENKAMRGALEALSAAPPAAAAKAVTPADVFTVEKVKYKFRVPKLSFLDKETKKPVSITAQDALSDKAILKMLVEQQSAAIVRVD